MSEDELSNLIQQGESDRLDFKQEWHENKARLLHDILCMVNSYTTGKRYIVLGVKDNKEIIGLKDSKNRMPDHCLQDWLAKVGLNKNHVRLRLFKLNLADNEIDVIEIDDVPLKPFYLLKDYTDRSNKEAVVKAFHIYTRTHSRNTSIDSQADEYSIELMWKERFRLNLTPLGRVNLLLNETKKWIKTGSEDNFHHSDFPEFTIHTSSTREGFSESWIDNAMFSDTKHNSLDTYELRYFNTVLAEAMIVNLDGCRYNLPLPKKNEEKFFISMDSLAYKIARLLRQDDDLDTTLKFRCNVEIVD